MGEIKFRAYHKTDFDTPDGPLKFVQEEIEGEIFFVCEEDRDIRYSFEIPYLDDDWIVQQLVGLKDEDGKDIYEGDTLKLWCDSISALGRAEGEWIVKVVWDEERAAFLMAEKDGDRSLDWEFGERDFNGEPFKFRVIG